MSSCLSHRGVCISSSRLVELGRRVLISGIGAVFAFIAGYERERERELGIEFDYECFFFLFLFYEYHCSMNIIDGCGMM